MYRKTAVTLVCFILSGALALLYAGEIRQNFLKIKNATERQKTSQEEQEATLLENMSRALKMSLLRHYSLCKYEEVSLSEADIEVSTENPHMYYFQYEKFAGYYIFSQNPKTYLQIPIDEKVYLEPGAAIIRMNTAECEKKESTPQE